MLPGFQTLNLGNSRHGLASKHGFGVVGWAAGIYSSYLLNCGDGCSKVLRTTVPCALWNHHGAKLPSVCVSSSRVVSGDQKWSRWRPCHERCPGQGWCSSQGLAASWGHRPLWTLVSPCLTVRWCHHRLLRLRPFSVLPMRLRGPTPASPISVRYPAPFLSCSEEKRSLYNFQKEKSMNEYG